MRNILHASLRTLRRLLPLMMLCSIFVITPSCSPIFCDHPSHYDYGYHHKHHKHHKHKKNPNHKKHKHYHKKHKHHHHDD